MTHDMFESIVGDIPDEPNGKPPKPKPKRARKDASENFTEASKGLFQIAWAENQTEVEAARRFARKHGGKALYCHPWKSWIVWTGQRWEVDADGKVSLLAKEIADDLLSEAVEAGDRSAINYALKMSSSRGISAMLLLAQSELPADHSKFDADPWLLNCPNGTIDLKTGELRKHRREDFLTKLCPTPFHPEAESFVLDRFLEDVFVSHPMIEYVQRLMGYCATGETREQILPIFHGGGENGKSTFLEAIMGTLGSDYAGSAPKDLLIAKSGDSHPTELADLHGMRMIVSTESDSNRRLAESLVKQLTGSDTIKARRLYQDFWQFHPTHKLILQTNHKPCVKGTDHAIWRRLRLIPFNERFSGDRKDKSMPEKLRAQREGILAWIVRGCLEWQRGGLQEPEAVMVATAEYRSGEDIIGGFVAENCITLGAVEVRAKQFRDELAKWCESEGSHPPNAKAIGDWMEQNGFNKRSSNGTIYVGIGLKAKAEADS